MSVNGFTLDFWGTKYSEPISRFQYDCRSSATRAERTDRLRCGDLVPLAGNRDIQRRDRRPFVGGSANSGLWSTSRNCDRHCVLDHQPNGVSGRLFSTRAAISGTSPQGTKPRSQGRHRPTATKAPIYDNELTPLRPGPCLRDKHGLSRFMFPARVAPVRLGSAGPFQGSAFKWSHRAPCADASGRTRKEFRAISPAVGTEAVIAMRRASARSPGSSEMIRTTAVPVWA